MSIRNGTYVRFTIGGFVLAGALAGCGEGSDAVSSTTTVIAEATVTAEAPPSTPEPIPADTASTVIAEPAPGEAVDWRAGSAGVTVAESLVVAEYGEEGPQLAVAPNAGTDGTAGSGCVVDSEVTLPDGIWWGSLVAVSAEETAIDLACFRTVESAEAAGTDDAFEDYDIEDTEALVRAIPTNDQMTLHVQTNPSRLVTDEASETVSLALSDEPLVQAYLTEHPKTGGWLLIRDGQALEFYVISRTSA